MNKFGAFLASLLIAAALAACGNKQSATAVDSSAPPVSEAADMPPAQSTAEATSDALQDTDQAADQPTESISEIEDDESQATQPTAATVQPALRLGSAAATAPASSQFKEGSNYTRLVPAQPTGVAPGKVEVAEVFWYGCGHCFALDPAIESWRAKTKPAYIEFVRVPAMWNETTRMHARLFFTAELLGKLDEMHAPIFREINMKGNQLNTVDKIAALFKAHGVSSDDFQKAFTSFAVENKLQRADFLNRRYRIDSVPAIIVNGKYKTDVSSAGGEPQLFTLIDELSAHEHGG